MARIRRTVRQMGAADDAAVSLRGQLIDAADDLASGRIGFGLHHASIAIFARDEAELDEAAAQVRAAGQRAGCVLVREDIGARATWFAQHPGNHGYRARAAMISSRNFAHFTALHAPPAGLGRRRDPVGRGGDHPADRERERLPLQLPPGRQGSASAPSATRWCSARPARARPSAPPS